MRLWPPSSAPMHEPYEVKRSWVDALNLRGVLQVEEGQKQIKLICELEASSGSFETPLPTKYGPILQISEVFELP